MHWVVDPCLGLYVLYMLQSPGLGLIDLFTFYDLDVEALQTKSISCSLDTPQNESLVGYDSPYVQSHSVHPEFQSFS